MMLLTQGNDKIRVYINLCVTLTSLYLSYTVTNWSHIQMCRTKTELKDLKGISSKQEFNLLPCEPEYSCLAFPNL